jgi:hypothetical protein
MDRYALFKQYNSAKHIENYAKIHQKCQNLQIMRKMKLGLHYNEFCFKM